MDIQQLLSQATDSVTVKRVFGEPIVQDGALVIPVAKLRGGGGGGAGTKDDDSGSGGGLGFTASPVGVYVLRDGVLRWQPALDLNRVILGGQIVGVAFLLLLRSLLRRGATERP